MQSYPNCGPVQRKQSENQSLNFGILCFFSTEIFVLKAARQAIGACKAQPFTWSDLGSSRGRGFYIKAFLARCCYSVGCWWFPHLARAAPAPAPDAAIPTPKRCTTPLPPGTKPLPQSRPFISSFVALFFQPSPSGGTCPWT